MIFGLILDSRMTFSWKILFLLGLPVVVVVGLIQMKSFSKGM